MTTFQTLTPPFSIQFPGHWNMIGKVYWGINDIRERTRSVLLLAFPPIKICRLSSTLLNDKMSVHLKSDDLIPQYIEIRSPRTACDSPPIEWTQTSPQNYETWSMFLSSIGESRQAREEFDFFGPKLQSFQQTWHLI